MIEYPRWFLPKNPIPKAIVMTNPRLPIHTNHDPRKPTTVIACLDVSRLIPSAANDEVVKCPED